jgi:hypothetical protein
VESGEFMGTKNLVDALCKEFPKLYHGYFNPGSEIVFRNRKV